MKTFLTSREVQQVLADLNRRARRFPTARTNRTVFRLLCCCGLRRTEAARLQLRDLMLVGPQPCLRVRQETTKGHNGERHGREVPLAWDKGTRDDLLEWLELRRAQGAGSEDPLIVSRTGKPLCGGALARRWRTAIRCLGRERVAQLPAHSGRRSYASLCFAAGRSPVAIRDALGHKRLATTDIYLHAEEEDGLPDVFAVRV